MSTAEIELAGDVVAGLPVMESLPQTRNPYLAYIAVLAKGDSRRAMAGCLGRIAELLSPDPDDPCSPERFPWGDLRAEHTAAARALIEQQTKTVGGQTKAWTPSYRNKHLASLRGVLKQAWVLGVLPDGELDRIRETLKDFRGSRIRRTRNVVLDELEKLLRVCLADETPAGLCDAALIAVLYSTGMRRAELASLEVQDYDRNTTEIVLIGKGDKERKSFLNPIAATIVGLWLDCFEKNGRPKKGRPTVFTRTAPLFPAIHKSGTIQAKGFTAAVVLNKLNKRRGQAGLPPMTPHDFRATFIGNLLSNGIDLVTVGRLVGHASPRTTAGYDPRADDVMQAAVNGMTMPDGLGLPPAATDHDGS